MGFTTRFELQSQTARLSRAITACRRLRDVTLHGNPFPEGIVRGLTVLLLILLNYNSPSKERILKFGLVPVQSPLLRGIFVNFFSSTY